MRCQIARAAADCAGRAYAASYCQFWFATTLEPNLKVCTVPCQPITSAGCDPTWSCQILWEGTRSVYLTDCDQAGAKAVGSTCAASSECARSLVCFNSVCKRYCHVGGPASDCPGTFNSCQTVQNHAWIGGIEFGVCLLGQ